MLCSSSAGSEPSLVNYYRILGKASRRCSFRTTSFQGRPEALLEASHQNPLTSGSCQLMSPHDNQPTSCGEWKPIQRKPGCPRADVRNKQLFQRKQTGKWRDVNGPCHPGMADGKRGGRLGHHFSRDPTACSHPVDAAEQPRVEPS